MSVAETRRGPGRPLDPALDDAIITAALDGLSEVGYDRLTVDMIASRARVGKATVYRRWSSKAELVMDALAAQKSDLVEPDTGSLRGDLEALISGDAVPDDPGAGPLVCGLMTAASRDPSLAATLHQRFIEPRKSLIRRIVARAMVRGEVPGDRDVELILNVAPAVIFSRAVLYGESIGPDLFQQVITRLVYPLLVAPDSTQWDAAGPAERMTQK